jgi:hypothetical protein
MELLMLKIFIKIMIHLSAILIVVNLFSLAFAIMYLNNYGIAILNFVGIILSAVGFYNLSDLEFILSIKEEIEKENIDKLN